MYYKQLDNKQVMSLSIIQMISQGLMMMIFVMHPNHTSISESPPLRLCQNFLVTVKLNQEIFFPNYTSVVLKNPKISKFIINNPIS